MGNTKQELNQGPAAPGTARHTPGPWRLDEWEHLVGANGKPIRLAGVSLASGFAGAEQQEIEANVSLVTAAPALADALEAIANETGDTGRNLAWARLHARAALRAAGRLT